MAKQPAPLGTVLREDYDRVGAELARVRNELTCREQDYGGLLATAEAVAAERDDAKAERDSVAHHSEIWRQKAEAAEARVSQLEGERDQEPRMPEWRDDAEAAKLIAATKGSDSPAPLGTVMREDSGERISEAKLAIFASWWDRAEKAESDLAAAREALERIASDEHGMQGVHIARAALAALPEDGKDG